MRTLQDVHFVPVKSVGRSHVRICPRRFLLLFLVFLFFFILNRQADRHSSEALRVADEEQVKLKGSIRSASRALEQADDERRRLVNLVAQAKQDEAAQRAREAEAKARADIYRAEQERKVRKDQTL